MNANGVLAHRLFKADLAHLHDFVGVVLKELEQGLAGLLVQELRGKIEVAEQPGQERMALALQGGHLSPLFIVGPVELPKGKIGSAEWPMTQHLVHFGKHQNDAGILGVGLAGIVVFNNLGLGRPPR
jgi:hypothetical protein